MKLREEQEKVLKEQIRELERSKKREGVNTDYLKNIVYKFIISDEQDVSGREREKERERERKKKKEKRGCKY